jgi:hypothetical protein
MHTKKSGSLRCLYLSVKRPLFPIVSVLGLALIPVERKTAERKGRPKRKKRGVTSPTPSSCSPVLPSTTELFFHSCNTSASVDRRCSRNPDRHCNLHRWYVYLARLFPLMLSSLLNFEVLIFLGSFCCGVVRKLHCYLSSRLVWGLRDGGSMKFEYVSDLAKWVYSAKFSSFCGFLPHPSADAILSWFISRYVVDISAAGVS